MPDGKTKSTGPQPLPQQDDAAPVDVAPVDRVAEFLQQAGGIISLERGINARSRMKLAALADALGLSEDELEQAMGQLLGGDAKQKKLSRQELRDLRRRKSAFHDLVGETLMALPQGVLTASMEQMLVTTGVDEHGLSREDAQAEVLELAAKLRICRITYEEAVLHITGLAAAATGPTGILPGDVRQRICAEASRYGLTPDQVEPIFKGCVSRVRQGQQREQYRTVALISVSAAVLMGVLGMIAWMAFTRALPDTKPPPTIADVDAPDDPAGVPDGGDTPAIKSTSPDRWPVPKWWDEDISSAVANARLRIPTSQGDLYQLRSPQAKDRQAAYASLMQKARTDGLAETERAILSSLFASAYAIEPSDECAAGIRTQLMAVAVGPGEKLPANVDGYRTAMWASETAVAALIHEKLSPERSSGLIAELERTLHAVIDGSLAPARLQRQIMTAAAEHAYKSLTRAAGDNVPLAVDIHEVLLDEIETYFDTATQERLSTDYLVAVLPGLGDDWSRYENMIRRSAQSEDPLNVLKMVDVFERTSVAGLQNFLAIPLALRAGITSPRGTASELAAEVREALGAASLTRPRDNRERAAQWQELADKALGEPAPAADKPEELMQKTVELARLSTMAAALAQGDLGAAEFDTLLDKEAPRIAGRSTSSRPTGVPAAPRLHANQLKNLDKYIGYLRNYRRIENSRTRLAYLRNIATYTGSMTDIQPEQGHDLAIYLAAAKPFDEHEQVLTMIDGILRWKMVRLGLADQLADSRLRDEHMQQMLELALHHDVDMKDGWRGRLRDELIEGVARQLASEDSLTRISESPPDRAASALADYYRTQARLAGIGATGEFESPSPSQLVKLLVEQQAARLSATATSPSARELAAHAAHELAAMEYLTENDLARTVANERLLIELRAAELAPRHAARTPQVDQIIVPWRKGDQTADNVLDQLYQNQRAMLQLWKLGMTY